MIAHPGAGGDPRVGQLHRPAQPLQRPGGQGVHRHHAGGLQPPAHRLDQLPALHPRGAQHPGGQGGHRPEGPEVLWNLLHQVAGHQGVLVDLGADGVRGDGPVAQPHHQRQPPVGHPVHEPGQLSPHRPGRPGKGVLLPAGQAVHGEGHIPPRRLAQGLLPPLVQDVHRLRQKSLPGLREGLHPLQPGGLPGALLPQLLGLQGQIGPPLAHMGPLLI